MSNTNSNLANILDINNSDLNAASSIATATTANMKTIPNQLPLNTPHKSENSVTSDPLSALSEHQIDEQTLSGMVFRQAGSKSSSEFFNQQKISPENFAAFCEQLRSFVQCVKNVQELTNLTYNLPSRLQESLDEEAKELDCLYGEVREATNNIERIKAQRKAIRKEKYAAEKLQKKLTEEETREMETVISVYDRGMFARWEIIKNSKKLEAIENFLCDIEGKLLAMKHLKILATQKMNKVITWTLKETTEKKNRKDTKRTLPENKDNTTGPVSGCLTEQEMRRRTRTRQSRLSKTELPRMDTINATTATVVASTSPPPPRGTVYSTILHAPDDTDIHDRSHDSIRTVELNSEMQSVLRTLFGGPARRETSTPNTQIGTANATATLSTTTTAPSTGVNENREIHIYLSHSYQN